MATLKDNYKAIIDSIVNLINTKLLKKADKTDLIPLGNRIDDTNKEINKLKNVDATTNIRLLQLEDEIEDKLEYWDLGTINGQPLVTENRERVDCNLYMPKRDIKEDSRHFTEGEYGSSVELKTYYPDPTITQSTINSEYSTILTNQTTSTNFYLGQYTRKNHHAASYNNKELHEWTIKTNPGDLIVVKLFYAVARNSAGYGDQAYTSSNYYNYIYDDYYILGENGKNDEWKILEDRKHNFGTEYDFRYVRHLVFCKQAHKTNEVISIRFNNLSSSGSVSVPQYYINIVSLSNVEGIEYINSEKYAELYTEYHQSHSEADAGILPVPTLRENDLALLCSSNKYLKGGPSSGGDDSWKEGYIGPSKNFDYNDAYFSTYGTILTDVPAGWLSTSGYYNNVFTDPEYALTSCIILRGVRDSNTKIPSEKFQCMYYISGYSPMTYQRDLSEYDVTKNVFFRKKTTYYSDSLNKNSEIANHDYVTRYASPKRMTLEFKLNACDDQSDNILKCTEIQSLRYYGKSTNPGLQVLQQPDKTAQELLTEFSDGVDSEFAYYAGRRQGYAIECKISSELSEPTRTFGGEESFPLYCKGRDRYLFEKNPYGTILTCYHFEGYSYCYDLAKQSKIIDRKFDLYFTNYYIELVITPVNQLNEYKFDNSNLTFSNEEYGKINECTQDCLYAPYAQTPTFVWNKKDLQHSYTLKEFTSSTFHPENDNLYAANQMKKFRAPYINTYYGTAKTTIKTDVGDTIFVFVMTTSNAEIVSDIEGWTKSYSGNAYSTLFPMAIFTKTATSDYEDISFSLSEGDGNIWIQYISISDVDTFTIASTSWSAGDTVPMFFFECGLDRNAEVNRYLTGKRVSTLQEIYYNSKYYHFNMVYCGENTVTSTYGRSVIGINLTFTGTHPEGYSLAGVFSGSGTFDKVPTNATFDPTAIYYERGPLAYKGSEIATQADLAISSAELTEIINSLGGETA